MPYIDTHRNKWNDPLTRPEVDGIALEAEAAVGPDDVGAHEATYRWVDEMVAEEGMTRVDIGELAVFYVLPHAPGNLASPAPRGRRVCRRHARHQPRARSGARR